MKLMALLLAIALTFGVGYASQAAMAADVGRFYRLTGGVDPAAVWFGGTLPPVVVTGRCAAADVVERISMGRHAARGAARLRSAGTLPPIVVTAQAPSVRHLVTSCGTREPARWPVD